MAILLVLASAQLPGDWTRASPLPSGELQSRLGACCTAGDLRHALRYIVWPPETAPKTHSHPCCGAPLPLPLVRHGVSTGRVLGHFAERLRKAEPARIAVLGSALSDVTYAGCTAKVNDLAQAFGPVDKRCATGRGWARMFSEFLDAAFPSRADRRNNTVYALGRGGSGPDTFDECYQTHLPADVDLYVLEMGYLLAGNDHADFDSADPTTDPTDLASNAGGPGGRGARGGARNAAREPAVGAALERLVRRILSMPHRPGILLVNMFAWCRTTAGECFKSVKADPTGANRSVYLNAFSATEAETAPAGQKPVAASLAALRANEVSAAIGRHYGLPVVSARDALFAAIRSGEESFADWTTPHLTFTNHFREELRPGYRMQALVASLLVQAVATSINQAPGGVMDGTALVSEDRYAVARAAGRVAGGAGGSQAGGWQWGGLALPKAIYAENAAPRRWDTRACYAFGFERSYFDSANWLFAPRVAPPTLRSNGWTREVVGLTAHTGRRARKAGLRAAETGAEMEVVVDTTSLGAPSRQSPQPTIQVMYLPAEGWRGRRALEVGGGMEDGGPMSPQLRCISGCSCTGLRVDQTAGKASGATAAASIGLPAGRVRREPEHGRRKRRLAASDMRYAFAEFPVSASNECRLVLSQPGCTSCKKGAVLLELKVRMKNAITPSAIKAEL